MLNDAICNIIRTEPQVFRLICQFDRQPAAYIARSHLADLIEDRLFESLTASREGRRELSRWLTRRYDLPPVAYADFADTRRRLALLAPDSLSRLLTYAGAAAACSEIAKTIDRAGVAALKNAMGAEVYCFAVKRASFLLGDFLSALPPVSESPDWTQKIRSSGCRCLAQCLAGDSAAIHSRVTLKLGAEWPLDFSIDADDVQRQAAWAVLKRILLHEIDPEWSSCLN